MSMGFFRIISCLYHSNLCIAFPLSDLQGFDLTVLDLPAASSKLYIASSPFDLRDDDPTTPVPLPYKT